MREARMRALEVVGAYHSHPRSSPRPSTRDRREGVPGLIYLVVGRAGDGDAPPAGSWAWASAAFWYDGWNFQEVALVLEP
jgi:proteasome lid subunit RPN8/RPN11